MTITNKSSRNSKLLTAALIILWWSVWNYLHISIVRDAGIPYRQAALDGSVSTVLLAIACYFVVNIMRYYLPKDEKYLFVIIASLTLTTVWHFAVKVLLKSWYAHNSYYLRILEHTGGLRFSFGFLMIVCATVLAMLWYTQKEREEENLRKSDMERTAREAELNKLRQQLQPHFLFNSLNSISALTGTQPEKARHMIQQLADFLRGTLKSETQQWVTLSEDIEYLRLYLDIEKVRFGHRLQPNILCDDAAMHMKLPAMLLQPIVENAIKFGLYDTVGNVEISIRAASVNNQLQVTVCNPYDEATALPVQGTGFGLASTRRRLFLIFGRHDLLVVSKEAHQFTAAITIPQLKTTI
ncbi:MAG TPA: histidine kinase [Ferruginibacter sp.]|nr:histidine kinase [Ferruginibacter sp.]HMP20409.1 histidine kinase [Ferruginibacter sp.]